MGVDAVGTYPVGSFVLAQIPNGFSSTVINENGDVAVFILEAGLWRVGSFRSDPLLDDRVLILGADWRPLGHPGL